MRMYSLLLVLMLTACVAGKPPAPPEPQGSIEPVNYTNPVKNINHAQQKNEFEAKPIVVKESGTELKQFRGLDPATLELKPFVE